jgi:hypothetical protein
MANAGQQMVITRTGEGRMAAWSAGGAQRASAQACDGRTGSGRTARVHAGGAQLQVSGGCANTRWQARDVGPLGMQVRGGKHPT